MMRMMTIMTVLTAAAAVQAQPPAARPGDAPPNPAPRFNILFNDRYYQQATPQLALAAVLKAADLGAYDYMAAYLMDEAASDAEVAKRAKVFAKAAESDLRKIREIEKADPFKPAALNPLPADPDLFLARVANEAQYRGFNKLVSEIRERYVEDPSHIRDIKLFLRNGEVVPGGGGTAKLTLASDKAKVVNFRKVGARWFLADAMSDAVPAEKPEAKN